LLSFSAVAQNGGINFQGMARNAAGEALANQKISLRLSVLLNSESGTVEYSETKEVTTSGQGIFSVVVGDGNILTKTGNFSDINWKNSLKFLKVELDPSGGTNFALMGSSRLQAVPFAYYANGVDAENIQGTLPVAKGGTGVGSIAALKSSLGLDQVNNTADANKPLSTAAQAALETKVDKVTGKGLSANDYSSDEKTKLAAITGTNTGDQDLSGLATTAALASKANTTDVTTSLATKVDKVTGKELSSNDFTTAEKTKLAAITGTNTGDQDLSGYATTTALAGKANTTDLTTGLALKANTADVTNSLATKVDKVTGKGLSANDYTSAEKSKLAAITGTNTGDQDLSGLATNIALDLKANTTDVTNSLATKVDKVTGKGLSSNDYTDAEKSKLTAILGTNTGDQDLSGFATNIALDLKANTTDVTNSLAFKVDKILGKGLSSNDYTDAEKSKLTAILGTNTGDQDLSGFATNIALDLKANAVDVTTGLSTKVDKILGKGLSSTDFTQAEKDKLTAITGINTGDQDLSGLATTIDLDLKANAVDVTTGLSTKVDKITGKGLSSTDFTQPEKDKLALILGINNNEPVNLSALATKAELENDYAKLNEENSFSEDQIFEGSINFRGDNESRINFSDVYNSSIRTYNYDGYPGGVLISTDEIIFLGKDEDDVEAFDGWSFDVVTGKLKFPGRKTEMFQEGSVFNIIGENDLYLSGGRENEEGEGKWGEIGISSYERLYLQINQDDQDDQEISAGISLNHEEENSPMNIEIYNSGNYWRFDPSGTLTLPNNSKISDDGQGLGINTEGGIFIFSGSMENEEESDENEEESDENEEESDENEAEFFTGLYLDKEFGINFFISGEEGGASISINQAYEDDIHVNVNNLGYEWVFDSEGRLKFPNNTHISDSEGTFRIESPNALVFMGDLDNEDFGASIAISPDEWYDSEGDIDEDLETEGSIFITTLDLDYDIFNTWKFGESGNLVFPDGTFFGVLEGDNTIGFETKENSDFLLVTSDEFESFEWDFTKDGDLIFPGGTLFGAGEDVNTIGFVTEEDSDFFILTGDEEFEWTFTNDGELMFPDGTLFGEVGASGTIGFVTEEDSDFSIATSSSNNDYEWQFTKDGVFKLPGLTGSASFRVINDAPFFSPVALQITSPNAFQLKSQSTGKTWNLESNGNTVFPADFAVVGELKIGTENIFDKFVSETHPTSFNGTTSQDFELNSVPRSGNQVAMYIDGVRVKRSAYSVRISNNPAIAVVTYTKLSSETGNKDVQFDYIKN
jgi:hypothetical protein